MSEHAQDADARSELARLADIAGLDVVGGAIRRTSSRFCIGVEHGDYNGTELFGLGTDRFLWLAYKPNASGRVRLFSGNWASYEGGIIPSTTWDLHPDGELFVFVTNPVTATGDLEPPIIPVEIVVNWFEELKQRVPN